MPKSIKFVLFTLLTLILILIIYLGNTYLQKSILRAPLAESMIDPTSVLFRNEKISNKYLCGEVNAKNRLGTYTGFSRYISNKNGHYIEGEKIVGNNNAGYGEAYFKIQVSAFLSDKGVESTNDFNVLWNIICLIK